jgi:hypothetical protein
MAVGDPFKVALVGGLYGQSIVNVFHYQQSTANTSTLSDVESLARAFNDQVVPDVQGAVSEDMQYGTVEARSFVPPGGVLLGFDLSIVGNGAGAQPGLPPASAVVIRKRTARLGRKYRGRNYFAGVPADDVAAGALVTGGGTPTRWGAVATAMLANIVWTAAGSPTFIPVIAALDPSVIVAPVGVRVQPITSTFLDTVLRQQRRREIGVGA